MNDQKPWMTPAIRKELVLMVQTEVTKQMSPMTNKVGALEVSVAAVKTETEAQSKWQKQLWGNGSGTPGYLEKARAEDNDRYNKLLNGVAELKNQVDTEKTVDKAVEAALAEAAKGRDHRLKRWIEVLGVLAALGAGGWIAHLIDAAKATGH